MVAIDETTLDPVARLLRGTPAMARLPGKLAGVFDLRTQQWRTVRTTTDPHQNKRVLARDLVAALPRGSLILADPGSFGFAWFDDLTEAGHQWVTRLRARTSAPVIHTHYRRGDTFDGLVWLGGHRADKAKHAVRLVGFRVGITVHRYLTNVRDPRQLPAADLARLDARRRDIELAVKLVKRELGLHLLWSAKPAVLWQQVWAVLIIAQVEPVLPPEPPKPKGGRPCGPDRAALTGIIFVLKSGIPWEMLSQEMGCSSGVTCWQRMRDWQAAGVWDRLHLTLLDRLGGAGRIDWERACLDSASVPAQRGARRLAPTPPIAANRARNGT